MLATSRDSARRSPGGRGLTVLVTVVVLWLTTASGCDDDTPEPDTSEVDTVALELDLGAGSSELTPEVSDGFQNDVADTLSGYVVSAFLGDYPRADFVEALDWFTTGGAELAATHLDVLTGTLFEDAESVVATKLEVRLAPFAPGRQPAGVSAAVEFVFDVTEGGETSSATLTGRLLMVPETDGWRIFGFDVRRDDLPGEAVS